MTRNLAHEDAILGLLRAAATLVVFPAEDGTGGSDQGLVPPNTPPPYVAVRFSGGPTLGETINMTSSRRIVYADCHCAGETRNQALWVADLVESLLLDVKPAVAGRRPFPIRWDSDRDVRPDDSVWPAVWSKVVIYRLETIPG
jgi:hypothetical protein